jgi:hypothetical protein
MIARKSQIPRRGMTVVAVLACLIVLTLLGAALLKLSLARRQFNRELEHRLQADWLVESGIDRALARLATVNDYKGETWRLSAADLGLPESPGQALGPKPSGSAAAVITITVDHPRAESAGRRVRVQADYQAAGANRCRSSDELLVDLEPKKAGATP